MPAAPFTSTGTAPSSGGTTGPCSTGEESRTQAVFAGPEHGCGEVQERGAPSGVDHETLDLVEFPPGVLRHVKC